MKQSSTTRFSLEGVLRSAFKGVLDKVSGFFLGIGLRPNHITLAGFVGNAIAAILIGSGRLVAGGLIALLMGPLDAVDGAMARKLGQPSRFGAFLDSVTDRYDELILLAGLLFYFSRADNAWGIMLTFAAAVGSLMVSYTRARAEALDFSAKVGVMTRVERYIILVLGLLFKVPLYSVGIIAVLGNLTAMQRFFFVLKQSRDENSEIK